jgi:hypothetical protein
MESKLGKRGEYRAACTNLEKSQTALQKGHARRGSWLTSNKKTGT